jgi:hypothetical protein
MRLNIWKRISSHRSRFTTLTDAMSAWSRPVNLADHGLLGGRPSLIEEVKKHDPLTLSLYNSLLRSDHSRWQVVSRIGVRVPATSPTEQASVCLACLLEQHYKSPGDFTSLTQKLIFKLLFTKVLKYCQERGSGAE